MYEPLLGNRTVKRKLINLSPCDKNFNTNIEIEISKNIRL